VKEEERWEVESADYGGAEEDVVAPKCNALPDSLVLGVELLVKGC